jgi:hypothetical protein
MGLRVLRYYQAGEVKTGVATLVEPGWALPGQLRIAGDPMLLATSMATG